MIRRTGDCSAGPIAAEEFGYTFTSKAGRCRDYSLGVSFVRNGKYVVGVNFVRLSGPTRHEQMNPILTRARLPPSGAGSLYLKRLTARAREARFLIRGSAALCVFSIGEYSPPAPQCAAHLPHRDGLIAGGCGTISACLTRSYVIFTLPRNACGMHVAMYCVNFGH